MLVGQGRGFAAARGAHEVALLDEVGLVDLLHGAGILAHGGGYGVDTHGATLELVDDGGQYADVHVVQSVAVHIKSLQGIAGYIQRDGAVALDLREVAHAAQQAVGYTGGAARAPRYLDGALAGDLHLQQRGRAVDDAGKRLGVIVLQTAVDAEAGAQRSREHAAARGGADERERLEAQLHRARRRAALYHDVDTEVLHGAVEILLDDGRQTVYLVDEEHVVGLQRGEQSGQVAGLVEHRAAGGLDAHAELVGDDVAEGRLAETRRAVEQHMVERLAALLGGAHEDLEVLHHLMLPGKTVEPRGAQGTLYLFLFRGDTAAVETVVSH